MGFDFEPATNCLSLVNARLLGQAAAVSYGDAGACRAWAAENGLDQDFDFFSNVDTQGFVAQNDKIVLVAFRGTQVDCAADWLSDINSVLIDWDYPAGKVHRGFYQALRAVWGQTIGGKQILPQRLLNRGSRSVWLTGHSLGGALATLCAAQAQMVNQIPIQGLYTFGQPRAGSEAFSSALQSALGVRTFRFINNRDIVPRAPLYGMGFRHCGTELFFDSSEKMQTGIPAVEDLVAALKLSALALNLNPVREAATMFAKAALQAGWSGNVKSVVQDLMKEREQQSLGDVRALIGCGTENVADHDMVKCYMARLGSLLLAKPQSAAK